MFNIEKYKKQFPSWTKINKTMFSNGAKMLTPLADTEDILYFDLRNLFENTRLTNFNTNNIGSLYSYRTTSKINPITSIVAGDGNNLTSIDLEEVAFCTPTRMTYLETSAHSNVIYHYDAGSSTATLNEDIEIGDEPLYVVTSGFSYYQRKIGETIRDLKEAIEIVGLSETGKELRSVIYLNNDTFYKVEVPFSRITEVSLPVLINENENANIYIVVGKAAGYAPPMKRTTFDNGERTIYAAIENSYNIGIDLCYKMVSELESTSLIYERLFKVYLTDDEGNRIEPLDFFIGEKDECVVLDTNSNVHYFSSLWPDIYCPEATRDTKTHVHIITDKDFFELEERIDIWIKQDANSRNVESYEVKVICPDGTITYLNESLELIPDTYTFLDSPINLKFAFEVTETGTYKVEVICYETSGDEISNEIFVIVPSLSAEISFTTGGNYQNILSIGNNQIALLTGPEAAEKFQLHYDYYVENTDYSLYTLENYNNVTVS